MARRIGIYGVNEEVLRLIQLLDTNPDIAIVRYWNADRDEALEHAYALGPEVAAEISPLLVADPASFLDPGDIDAVIDSGEGASFSSTFPGAAKRGIQIVTPLTARLLWAYGAGGQDRKAELLQALAEIVESVDLAIDSHELFLRMLDIAVGATGADGGSLMLLDPKSKVLTIRQAAGVEPELWPKIRVPLGDGISGKVASEARPLFLRGKADAKVFNIVRERMDVESAICVPLIDQGEVLGVLNLHHSSKKDAFTKGDLAFAEQLARLDAQIISRAQKHEALRNQAARYNAVTQVRELLGSAALLLDRLARICELLAERVGYGIATVYLHEENDRELRLAATSLEGGGFGGEYRVIRGQGIDGRVAQTGEPAFLRESDGSLAYVCLPLKAGDRLVGVVSIQAGENSPKGQAAEDVLVEMAAAMAEGIAHADRENRLTTRATRANAINEAGIHMISIDDIGEVARHATSSAAMIFEAEHAVLRLQDDQTLRYVIRSYFGPADGRQQERLFRLDKEITVETIQRRTAFLLRDMDQDPQRREIADGVMSLISAPIKREGRVVGTLAIYDKVAPDRFYAADFNDEDLSAFTRFVSYVERAVETSLFHSFARQHRNFDEDTGLPNASYIGKRIHEEVARSGGGQSALAIASCQIENVEEIQRQAGAGQAHRVTLKVAEALKLHLRDFDVLGRSGRALFTILLPEPGHAPDQRVAELARVVADAVSKDESVMRPVRPELAFGYAVYPGDGEDRDTLIQRAEIPRIRM